MRSLSAQGSALKKRPAYYVYTYTDPRSGALFYVGKGCGRRAQSHLRRSHNPRVVLRIHQIRTSGHEPIVTLIADGLSEADALACERDEIARHRNLCNIQPGHLSWQERQRADARALIADVGRLRDEPNLMARAVKKAILAVSAMTVLQPTPERFTARDLQEWYASLTPLDHARLDKAADRGRELHRVYMRLVRFYLSANRIVSLHRHQQPIDDALQQFLNEFGAVIMEHAA